MRLVSMYFSFPIVAGLRPLLCRQSQVRVFRKRPAFRGLVPGDASHTSSTTISLLRRGRPASYFAPVPYNHFQLLVGPAQLLSPGVHSLSLPGLSHKTRSHTGVSQSTASKSHSTWLFVIFLDLSPGSDPRPCTLNYSCGLVPC